MRVIRWLGVGCLCLILLGWSPPLSEMGILGPLLTAEVVGEATFFLTLPPATVAGWALLNWGVDDRDAWQERRREAVERVAQQNSAAAWARLGHIHLSAGDPDGAVIAFLRALQLDSEDGPALYGLAQAHLARQDWNEAEEVLARLRGMVGYQSQAWAGLGLARAGQGDWAGAEAYFRLALTESAPTAALHYDLAQILWARSRLDEAQTHLEAALRLAPYRGEILILLGVIQEEAGRVDEARRSWMEARLLPPVAALASYNLVRIRVRGLPVRERVALWEAEPDSVLISLGRALTQAELGQYRKALEELRGPEGPSWEVLRGVLWEAVGDSDQARSHYIQALTLDPRDPYAPWGLIRINKGGFD